MNAAVCAAETIRGAAFGNATTFENLTMVPIVGGTSEPPVDYLTLDEALAGGAIEVTEVSNAGHVPELKVVVKGDRPVLLVQGEELVGAKQNRVLNITILAPAGRETVIPVSCVEAGRWHHVSRTFSSSSRAQFSSARAATLRQVTASMRRSPTSRASDQGAV